MIITNFLNILVTILSVRCYQLFFLFTFHILLWKLCNIQINWKICTHTPITNILQLALPRDQYLFTGVFFFVVFGGKIYIQWNVQVLSAPCSDFWQMHTPSSCQDTKHYQHPRNLLCAHSQSAPTTVPHRGNRCSKFFPS